MIGQEQEGRHLRMGVWSVIWFDEVVDSKTHDVWEGYVFAGNAEEALEIAKSGVAFMVTRVPESDPRYLEILESGCEGAEAVIEEEE